MFDAQGRLVNEVHARKMHAHEVHTYEIHARKIHAYEIYTYEIYAHETRPPDPHFTNGGRCELSEIEKSRIALIVEWATAPKPLFILALVSLSPTPTMAIARPNFLHATYYPIQVLIEEPNHRSPLSDSLSWTFAGHYLTHACNRMRQGPVFATWRPLVP
jgi:hypothetical protein